jgi:hypothetical protein
MKEKTEYIKRTFLLPRKITIHFLFYDIKTQFITSKTEKIARRRWECRKTTTAKLDHPNMVVIISHDVELRVGVQSLVELCFAETLLADARDHIRATNLATGTATGVANHGEHLRQEAEEGGRNNAIKISIIN